MDYPKYDYVMEREGLDKVCKYSVAKGANDPENPHRHEKRDFTKKILEDITDYIGNTPMVRLSNIAKTDGIQCEICTFTLLN
jgi:hypothetical protein